MCGIAGVFGSKAPEIIARMLRRIAHRGPDDQHLVSGDNYTLGTRRLSIMDLSEGRQPLTEDSRQIWASHNGEIYNFRELRQELLESSAGQGFTSDCDTEIIPHLYRAYGLDFPDKIEGMFAVSLYDRTRRLGLLVRDRAGQKPLYYMKHEGSLWYASEIKALLAVPGFQRRVNPEALHHYLSYKNVPNPLSIFEDIKMLPPAHLLLWKDGELESPKPYWRLNWAPFTGQLSEPELAEELLRRLRLATKKRLTSDVPVGLSLSGGLDSSLSLALAAERSSYQLKTFTLIFPEDKQHPGKQQDRLFAKKIAKQYGTSHFEQAVCEMDFQRELPTILSHFDEPFSGVLSTYFLSRLIADHVKVAISGDGSDELFGSYLSHRLARPISELYWNPIDCDSTQEHSGGTREHELMQRIAEREDWRWRHKLGVFTDEDKGDLYSLDYAQVTAKLSSREHLKHVMSHLSAKDPTNRILETEFLTQLPDQVLTFTDRLSMAHSLETRTPFLDTQVMEFAARIPDRFKISNGEVKTILKKAAQPCLPESLIQRPKEGFFLPVNHWLQGSSFNFAREVLNPTELRRHNFFCPKAVEALLRRFENGESKLANKILSLLSFQIWYDIYMNGSPAASSFPNQAKLAKS